jgi:hypothetical protein
LQQKGERGERRFAEHAVGRKLKLLGGGDPMGL